MKKLWHVWTAYVFCLAIGLIGMAWLTVRVVDLDRAEAEARRQAARARQQNELQERVAMALWRMDWMLTPMIAQEATRPSFVYRPFVKSPEHENRKSRTPSVASPLLTQPPVYVELNFDASPQTGWTSPQVPRQPDVAWAVDAGISSDVIEENRRKLQELNTSVSFHQLLQLLPDSFLPAIDRQLEASDPRETANNFAVVNDMGQRAGWQQGESEDQESRRVQEKDSRPQPQASPGGTQAQTSLRHPIASGTETADQSGASHVATREQQEWLRRNMGMQNVARSQRAQMMSNSLFMPESRLEREGVSRPVWIGSKLILARRVISGGEVRIQGCWLDWPHIKARLQREVADLFSDIQLFPVTSAENVPPGRSLATLPVQLVVPEPAAEPPVNAATGRYSLSAIRISLIIAWCCLLIGSIAVAIMLRSVLALSERRAAFVSAVTHELRSPLTTFRMYAEMLSEGMVRDGRQRDRYLATLRQEADRLTHLVENVLQYARLERGRKSRRRIEISVGELVKQTTERLPERVRQAGMELEEIQLPENAEAAVWTDPAAVEQILFNLVDNSCKYAAHGQDRRIHVHWSVGTKTAQVRVTDHGPGIRDAQAAKLFLPFRKSDQEAAQSAPGIGLGLALCRRLATDIGGKLHFEPRDGEGAAFLLELPLARKQHVQR